MFAKSLQIAFVSALFAFSVCAEEPQVMLLSNGQVVSGKIKKSNGNYVVSKSSGSRIVFAANRVVLVCSDLKEMYWKKCALLRASDVAGHVQLFHWCVKRDLIDAAQNQIDLLQHMKLSATKLYQLDQKLLDTRKALAANLKKKTNALVRRADALAAGKRDYNVKPVVFEQTVNSDTTKEKMEVVRKRKPEQAARKLGENSVDPFDPEVFNGKYVRGPQSESNESKSVDAAIGEKKQPDPS